MQWATIRIVKNSSDCITNTGEHQVEINSADSVNVDEELCCRICGLVLWEPGIDHAILDNLLYHCGL